MLFSRTTVHGVYALCYLNRARTGKPLSSHAVAAALGIPREQAAKVLQSLNHAQLVQSTRGRRGGYVLMKPLDEISIVDVLDALNPPEDDERLRPKTCNRKSGRLCSAHRGLLELNERARQALVGETLASLAGTICHVLDTPMCEPRAELVCVTQGESIP